MCKKEVVVILSALAKDFHKRKRRDNGRQIPDGS